MANIRLNFLPVSNSNFDFPIYRKPKQQDDLKEEDVYQYQLPIGLNLDERSDFYVSFIPKENYVEFNANSFHAIGLTRHFLQYRLLCNLVDIENIFPFELKSKLGDERIEFKIEELNQGSRIVFLSTYFFEEQRQFGFIIDYKFSRKEDYPFDKEVQRLSLSLDYHYRSNRNFYSDKYKFIQSFINLQLNRFKKFSISSDTYLEIKENLVEVPAFLLNRKEYIFNNAHIAHSQFQGIRNYGPFQKIDEKVLFVFLFEERMKSFANEIYLSLIGKTNPGTFPGFEQMFKIQLGIDNVRRIQLNGNSQDELTRAASEITALKQQHSEYKVIGIYLEDHVSDWDGSSTSYAYYFLKYQFIKNDTPLQVINYRVLGERNSLKWSSSNLALAIFAKLGGIPWVVKPSNNNCLILGVGSSHKRDKETGKINKYFAYSVCLDSSGIYKKLAVLADEQNEESYLENLRNNLVSLINEDTFSNYTSCVLHLPFKIKNKEVLAISEALKQIRDIEFVVIKVNLNNKFFGYSNHNTLVPYESSFIKLSKSEYLVWFEGLQFGKEIVDKRLSNPVHIQFLNIQNGYDEKKYLQDVLNLSGANWRGFNAKSIPISIYYSQIIAKYTEKFEEIPEYNENTISNEKPWFL